MTVSTRDHRNVAAERVLSMLQSWSDRFQRHVRQKRAHQRRPCNIKTTCVIPESKRVAGEVEDESFTEIWLRNISQGGVGFIAEGQLQTTNDLVIISLGPKYMLCRIVRSRQVHDGFWEYGVCFVEEASM